MCGVCAQSCLTLCDPCTVPGSSVHGILQARTVEWVARGFASPGDLSAQGLNPHVLPLLYWQADSLLLCHLGGPWSSPEVRNPRFHNRGPRFDPQLEN